MFKKILIADDLSPRARKILQTGLEMARCHQAELVILSVQPDFLDKDEMVMLRVDVSQFQDDMRRKAERIHTQIEKDLRELGGQETKAEILIREGKPIRVIPEVAREVKADLIVIGAHHVSRLKEKLFDGVAEQIILHAECNVLTVWTDEK